MGNHSFVFQAPFELPVSWPNLAMVAENVVCVVAAEIILSLIHFDSRYPCPTTTAGSSISSSSKAVGNAVISVNNVKHSTGSMPERSTYRVE